MKVLVFNCGSSSLKFKVIDPQAANGMRGRDHRLARGIIERIGGEATCTFEAGGLAPHREAAHISHHEEAVRKVLHWLDSTPGGAVAKTLLHDLDVVGHRIVHGGDRFTTSVVLDDQAIAALEALNELAPLHNPPALKAIQACRAVLGSSMPMVAAFDTAFHRTLPNYAAVYALPYELSQRHGIRRYGFHGLAHRYVTWRYAELTANPIDQVKLVTLHLGNG
jgi:acetate kinase